MFNDTIELLINKDFNKSAFRQIKLKINEIKTGRSESINTRLEALLIKSDLLNFSFQYLNKS